MRSLLALARTGLLNNLLNKNSLSAAFSGPREIRTVRSLLALARTGLLNNLLNKNSLSAVLSGPREIRTLGLLNAIETRSQLRYGPLFTHFLLFPMALPTPP